MPAQSPGVRCAHTARWGRSFLLALLAYAALRAWIVVTAFESVTIPVYEVATIGNLAWALAEGVPLMPVGDYYDNAGAQLLTGWLGSLSFSLFGPSYLALKLVPMVFGVALLAMVGRMLARQFSGRAALIGMLCVAVAPPIVTKYSMLAKGNHFEGLTLLFVALLAALETPEPGEPRRRQWVAFTGAALGFSISMYFGAMLTGVVLAVAWWTRFGVVRSVKDLPMLAGGLAVGLVPLLLMELGTAGRAVRYALIFGRPTSDVPVGQLVARGRSLFTEVLPEAACFEGWGGVPARFPEYLLLALTVLAFCVAAFEWARTFRRSGGDTIAVRRLRRATLWILLAYPAGVLAVVMLKGLPMMPKSPPVEVLGVRYLMGYFFFSLLLIAVAIDRLLGAVARAPRIAGAVLGLGLLVTSPFTVAIGSASSLPTWANRYEAAAYPGFHLRQYAVLFHHDLHFGEAEGVDTSRMKACLRSLSANGRGDQRAELAMGVGSLLAMLQIGYQGQWDGEGFSLDAITLDFDEQDRPNLLRGVGMFFQASARAKRLARVHGEPSVMMRRISAALEDDHAAMWVAEGLGMAQQYPLLRRLPSELNRSRNLLRIVPAGLRDSTLLGVARSLQRYRELGLARTESVIRRELKKFDERDQAALAGLLAG